MNQASDITGANGPEAVPDRMFREAVRSHRMPMLLLDARLEDHPILFANDAFARLTGFSPQEALGRGFGFLQGERTDRASADRIQAAMTAGKEIEAEILHYRKDGSPFWSSLVVSPVAEGGEAPRVLLAVQQDVSARRRSDEEVTQKRRHLEDEVGRRTRDLQAALDQKTSLLHEVDHRVKNSLQVISSLILLKARRIRNDETRRVLNDVSERVRALATVHRQLYAGGDVGRFDLGAFVDELATELAAALPPDRLSLDLQVPPIDVPAARAASLALLLNEVVGNAVKHAFPDGRRGTLTIRIERIENALRIVVADDGVGLRHAPAPEGSFGRTLIETLVRQAGGRVALTDAEPGTCAEIVMPMDPEETQFECR